MLYVRCAENRKVESKGIKLLCQNIGITCSWKVKNSNGKSEAERSNRVFDFSRLRRAMFMVWEAFSESGSNLLLFYVSSPFRIELSEARWADALLVYNC
jgi:hypothetical protein